MSSDSEPLVTVVMPAYNAARYVTSAIESVFDQTYAHLELIVVDDGSVDATAAAVRGFAGRLTCVQQPNAGQAAARNRGVREGRGELLAFIDADDEWASGKLEKQIRLWQTAPETGLIYCGVDDIDQDGRTLTSHNPRVSLDASGDLLLREIGAGVCGSTFLVSRAAFTLVGGFDETLTPCEDTDLFWRIACRSAIRCVEEPLVKYRQHATNAHRDIRRMRQAWLRFYAKALASREVKKRGILFRAKCRGRLHYMLAGDQFHSGSGATAWLHVAKALFWWPPTALRMAGRGGI